MPDIIFMGAEVGSNRTLLESMEVKNMGISYWGIVQRGLPKTKPWLISDRFQDDVNVYVESGAHQAVKAGLSREELIAFAADYEEFIVNNEDHIKGFTEFDAAPLGKEWLDEQREFWKDAGPLFWPVWHHQDGPNELLRLAKDFDNVAIPQEAIEEYKSLAAYTQSLQRQFGTTFHAIATAKPDNLRQVPFRTAGTLSWLSPMRRGETIVWDGIKLVRYPQKMKDKALLRHKTQAGKAGLDVDKFAAGDNVETTKMAVWSYLRLEESMDKKRPGNPFTVIDGDGESLLPDNSEEPSTEELVEWAGGASDNRGVEVRNDNHRGVVVRDTSEVMNLPVFGYDQMQVMDIDENGNQVLKDVPVVRSQAASLRQCNTCFVAANCPAFKPNNTCAFNLPVEVKTKEQLRGLLNSILEMQGQRVAFARFSEELNGGYPDPNLGQEIDRMFKLVKILKDLDSTQETFRLTMERQSSGGVLSAIFGDRASTLNELPAGGFNEDETTTIIAEVLEEDK